MSLYLWSIAVSNLPKATNTKLRYGQFVHLFGLAQDGSSVTLTVENFKPYVLLEPLYQDEVEQIDELTLQSAIVSACEVDESTRRSAIVYACKTLEVTIIEATPLIGFTNGRKDRLIQIHFEHAGHIKPFLDHLAQVSMNRLGDLVTVKSVLHSKVKPATQFLQCTGLRLQAWFDVHHKQKFEEKLCDTKSHYRVRVCDLAFSSQQDRVVPPYTTLFVRVFAHSSRATVQGSALRPDATIQGDYIRCIATRITKGTRVTEDRMLLGDGPSDSELLAAFHRLLKDQDVMLLVQASDEMNDLAYIQQRSGSRAPFWHLIAGSVPRDYGQRLSCVGRERLDVVPVLQKFMVSPPLDRHTLIGAAQHGGLTKPGSHRELCSAGYVPCHSFDTLAAIQADLARYIALMYDLVVDNEFVLQQQALAQACDLTITDICELGQQARVFNTFTRAYYQSQPRIYINHQQLQSPFVVLPTPRAQTSFPDPPWLHNTPREGSVHVEQHRRPNSKIKKAKTYTGGFVVPAEEGFYATPEESIVTLDFQSMYPSLIIGHCLCYRRILYDRQWLDDPRVETELVPLDDTTAAVLVKSYDGQPVKTITDRVLRDITAHRKRIRARMADVQDPFLYASLNAAQLSAKVLQNGTYGFLGSATSGMQCTALAAAVCTIGQWMNKTVRFTALSQFGCRCVGGDTDSCFLQFPTTPGLSDDDTFTSIYAQARALVDVVATLFPPPSRLEFECVKSPCLIVKKKTNACLVRSPKDHTIIDPVPKITGFAFKKRDRCAFVRAAGERVVHQLLLGRLTHLDLQSLLETFNPSPTTIESLQPYILTVEYGISEKAEHTIATQVASIILEDTGLRPVLGTRLAYVVVRRAGLKHYQCATTPLRFLRDHMALDANYYLQTQLLLPLKQLLSLPEHEALQRRVVSVVESHRVQLECKRTGQQDLLRFFTKKPKCDT